MAVKIVTDSTSDLPPDLARLLDITVVPLNVHFGAQSLRDGVDLTTDDFFVRLPQSQTLPTTSQPSAGAFLETYGPLLEAGHQVLSLHVSAKLSGTMNSALLAQRELPAAAPLEIVDTGVTSMALGLVALEAARTAQAGASLAECAAAARRVMSRTHLMMFLETLEYLQKGGRIGRAQALLGSLLSFKPLLEFKDSEVQPAGRVRTRSKAIDYLLGWASGFPRVKELVVLYSTTPGEAADLKGRLEARFPAASVMLAKYGPVVGVHVGPAGMAIVVREDDPAE